jgi:hypothetical protein
MENRDLFVATDKLSVEGIPHKSGESHDQKERDHRSADSQHCIEEDFKYHGDL